MTLVQWYPKITALPLGTAVSLVSFLNHAHAFENCLCRRLGLDVPSVSAMIPMDDMVPIVLMIRLRSGTLTLGVQGEAVFGKWSRNDSNLGGIGTVLVQLWPFKLGWLIYLLTATGRIKVNPSLFCLHSALTCLACIGS